MTDITIPNFGELLAPFIGSVPETAMPAFLARLERTAAARYRGWAEDVPEHAEGLLACAEREDDIARRVDALYPATAPDQISAMDAAIGPAKDTYYAVFAELSPIEQMTIQANAERQGANAWRNMIDAEADPDRRAALEACAQIEEANADYLDALLPLLTTQAAASA